MRTPRPSSKPRRGRIEPGWTDPQPALAPRPWYLQPVALALTCLVVAVALRAWRVASALPEGPFAAMPVRDAWRMMDPITGALAHDWGAGATLASAIHLVFQRLLYVTGLASGVWSRPADFAVASALDPAPMFVAARGAEILCDAIAVLLAYRLGERMGRGAGVFAGLLAAVAPVSIAAARAVDAVSPMTALALIAVDRMLDWRERGGRTSLLLAAALIGLAVSASPLAVALLAPLAWVAWERRGWRAYAPVLGAVMVAALTFALATPKAIVDPRAFVEAWSAHAPSMSALPGLLVVAAALTLSLGPAGLALAAFAVVALPVSTRGRHPGVTLAVASLAFAAVGVVAMPGSVAALSPSAMLLAPLAAVAGTTLYERFRLQLSPRALAACMAMVLVPPAVAGAHAGWMGSDRTTAAARRWCERTLDDGIAVVHDLGPQWLPTRDDLARQIPAAVLAQASPDWRARHRARRPYRAVTLPAFGNGTVAHDIRVEGRVVATRHVFSDAEAAGDARYEPALFAGADVVVLGDAARLDARSNPERHPNASRLFDVLDQHADRVTTFAPVGSRSGSAVRVYAIGAAARAALAGEGLDPVWWTRRVAPDYRAVAQATLGAPPAEAALAADAYGQPTAWVESLEPFYEARYAGYVHGLAEAYAQRDRWTLARGLVGATLRVAPDDVDACRLASLAARRTADWPRARAIVERTLEARRGRPLDPTLGVEHARTLLRTGEAEGARARLVAIARSDVGDSAASEARFLLGTLP